MGASSDAKWGWQKMGCAWTHSSYTKLMHANATIGETKSTPRAMYFSVPGVAYQIRCSLVRNSAGARYDARVPGMFSAATVQFTLLSHPQGQMYSRKPPTLGQLLDAVVREGCYCQVVAGGKRAVWHEKGRGRMGHQTRVGWQRPPGC